MIFDRHLVYQSEGNIRVDIFKKVCFNPQRTFLEKNLSNLSTPTMDTFDPLKSKIHLLIFTLYERGMAGYTPLKN